MIERQQSKALVLVSTSSLCERVIQQRGVNRTENTIRVDADYDGSNNEKIRLIQQGFGQAAIFTLRVQEFMENQSDRYRYDVTNNTVYQLDKYGQETPVQLPPSMINRYLFDGLDAAA